MIRLIYVFLGKFIELLRKMSFQHIHTKLKGYATEVIDSLSKFSNDYFREYLQVFDPNNQSLTYTLGDSKFILRSEIYVKTQKVALRTYQVISSTDSPTGFKDQEMANPLVVIDINNGIYIDGTATNLVQLLPTYFHSVVNQLHKRSP